MYEKRDRVTISLFSVENGNGFSGSLFNQKENIARIQKKLSDAAIAAGREPPEFVLSVLLVPDWKKPNNGYEHPKYKEIQSEFMKQNKAHFGDMDVKVQDFYNEGNLTDSEKEFMNNLEALGSNADIIKNRAIINNQDRRHLQIDSNTLIHDYQKFYDQTFGAPAAQQADALNASYYDKNTLSAHNKMVYTPPPPNGRIGPALEQHYIAYCEQNKNNNSQGMKGARSNRIYTAFNNALESIGLAVKCTGYNGTWDFLRAKIEGNEAIYRLTSTVVTAINMSWASKPFEALSPEEKSSSKAKKELQGVVAQVGDASCDFQSFDYLIKKHAGKLWDKTEQDNGFAKLALGSNTSQGDIRLSLNAISDEQLDLKILASYYNEVSEHHPEKLPLLVDRLKNINPPGTKANFNYDVKAADKLFQKLFNCTLDEFNRNPKTKAIVPQSLSAEKAPPIQDTKSTAPTVPPEQPYAKSTAPTVPPEQPSAKMTSPGSSFNVSKPASSQNVQQAPAASLPLQNKLLSTYPYGKSGSRIHFYTVESKGLEKSYVDKTTAKPLRGDALKRAILDDFKQDLEKCTSEKELESCYKKFKDTPEYTILETHQRPQTFKFEKSKTSAIQALETMCSDAKHLLNPNAKQEMKNEQGNENQSSMNFKP